VRLAAFEGEKQNGVDRHCTQPLTQINAIQQGGVNVDQDQVERIPFPGGKRLRRRTGKLGG